MKDSNRNPEVIVSYFQTRTLPRSRKLLKDLATKKSLPQSLKALEYFKFTEIEEENLFDADTQSTRLFRRFISTKDIFLEQDCIKPKILLSLLIASTGYYVIGVTIIATRHDMTSSDTCPDSNNSFLSWLSTITAPGYYRDTLKGKWKWYFGDSIQKESGETREFIEFECGVYDAIEIIGLGIHETLMNRDFRNSLVKYSDKSSNNYGIKINCENNSQRINLPVKDIREKLFKKRELITNYVATFGYHCDISCTSKSSIYTRDKILKQIVDKRLERIDNTLQTKDFKELIKNDDQLWLTNGLESLRFTSHSLATDELKGLNISANFAEYIAYRRGVLAVIERDTQRIISEKKPAFGNQLKYWNWLLSSITDDFALGRNVDILMTSKSFIKDGIDHFDLINFEQHTRQNVASFSERLNIKRANSANILSILFGILASITLSDLLDEHIPLSFIFVVIISFGLLILIIAPILYNSRYLKPPNNRYLSGNR